MASACALRRPPSAHAMMPVRKTAAAPASAREHADAGERCAEERDGGARLQRDDGAVIDVAPVEMAPAEDVVHLVAEVAPADVRLPEIGAEVKGELQQREQGGENERLAERATISSRARC